MNQISVRAQLDVPYEAQCWEIRGYSVFIQKRTARNPSSKLPVASVSVLLPTSPS